MLRFEELNDDAQLLAAFELMTILRPTLARETFVEDVRAMEPEGYRLIGGYAGDALVVIGGARAGLTLGRGRHAYVNELITHPAHRGQGHATAMLRHIAARAAANGVPRMYLTSYSAANAFYDKLGFERLEATPRWIECEKLGPA